MVIHYDPDAAPRTLARLDDGPHGELVLRQVGAHYEIISNGTFLMDTRNGESERLLVDLALSRVGDGADVLIGGLGVGFSLNRALANPAVRSVTVIEALRPVIDWHRGPLAEFSGHAVDDPRVTVVHADLIEWFATASARFDAVCLDIDNGPDWTVVTENAALYDDSGIGTMAAKLRPGGVATVWSAADSPDYRRRLRRRFDDVTTMDVPVPHGTPDVVFVAAGVIDTAA